MNANPVSWPLLLSLCSTGFHASSSGSFMMPGSGENHWLWGFWPAERPFFSHRLPPGHEEIRKKARLISMPGSVPRRDIIRASQEAGLFL